MGDKRVISDYFSAMRMGQRCKEYKVAYEETKVRVARHMTYQDSEWIKVAWERGTKKEGKPLRATVKLSMYSKNAVLDEDGIHLDGDKMVGT